MRRLTAALALLTLVLSACRPASTTPGPLGGTQPASSQTGTVTVNISVDGKTQAYALPASLTVREALAHAGIAVGELDRLFPAPYSLLHDGLSIVVTRITETFETEQSILPFASQTVRNEGLPEGERRLLQVGQNGTEELTYRTVFEDGVQVSRSLVKRVVLAAAVPEIIMLGSQGSFTLVPISGTLAYLNGRDAWVMRGNSGQRYPLTSVGDLDGFVFDLSPDGQWLLFTRAVSNTSSAAFNTLWAMPTALTTAASPPITATTRVTGTKPVTTTTPITRTSSPVMVSVPISNVLYAEWSPVTARTFAYSTAEKIARAPGWQSNNDLWLMRWGTGRNNQLVYTRTLLLDSSAGGLYGWWGTGFAFAPSGDTIAYARTDSIGLVQFTVAPKTYAASVRTSELAAFTAFNTHSDWAWYPALSWSPDGRFLFSTLHSPPIGLEAAEDSPAFDLAVLSVREGRSFNLIPRAGIFANPAPSPVHPVENDAAAFQVAFMQASDPNNSPFSSYRLGLMDRDGSNVRFVFPPQDQAGLPANERAAWSPDGRLLVVAYQGNLWLIDTGSGLTQQLTGDGLIAHPSWGP